MTTLLRSKGHSKPLVVVFFGIALAFIAAVTALGIRSSTGTIAGVENYVANIASLLPFGYAFAAGMVASVNPCGFFLLPTFAAYYVSSPEEVSGSPSAAPANLFRGILAGLAATVGFVVLFSAIGIVITVSGRAIISVFPWAGFSIGVAMALLGIWLLLTGRSLGITMASRVSTPVGRGVPSFFMFGIAYGTCSLACTLPIFLVVVGTSLATRGLVSALTQFVAYGVGMGVILVVIAVAASTLKSTVVGSLKGLLPYVHRLSALFMVGAGFYMIFYWVVLGEIFG